MQAKIAEIATHYPDGVVHIISRHNREKNTTAGAISTASLQLAAECLVNNTHDLASPEQIATFKRDQQERRRQILMTERSKKTEHILVVNQSEAESKGLPLPIESEPAMKPKPVTNKQVSA